MTADAAAACVFRAATKGVVTGGGFQGCGRNGNWPRSFAHSPTASSSRCIENAVKGGRSNGEGSGVKRFRFRRRGEKRILAIEPLGQQTRTESADTKREGEFCSTILLRRRRVLRGFGRRASGSAVSLQIDIGQPHIKREERGGDRRRRASLPPSGSGAFELLIWELSSQGHKHRNGTRQTATAIAVRENTLRGAP